MPPDLFIAVHQNLIIQPHGSLPDCWTKLAQSLNAGYQIMIPGTGYFVAEGDLPQAAVEKCAASALNAEITKSSDGELIEFQTIRGTAFAAWSGRYVVLGSRKKVIGALHTPTRETEARWSALLTPLANAPIWMVSTDTSYAFLLGESVTSFQFTLDTMRKIPQPFMAGRFTIHYSTPADAQAGAHWIATWIKQGEFPRKLVASPEVIALYKRIVTSFQKLKMTQDENTIELGFDSDMFGDVDFDMITTTAAQLHTITH